jgi:hypothetical protein
MKKIVYSMLGLVLISGVFYSCKKENVADQIVGETYQKDQLFIIVSERSQDLDKDKTLEITYEYNKNNQTLKVLNTEVVDNTIETNQLIFEKNQTIREKSGEPLPPIYSVNCDYTNKYYTDWSEDARSKEAAWDLMKKCLDKGGCAEICTSKLIFIPKIETFVLNVTPIKSNKY